MLKYFLCPDGNKIEVEDCLEKCTNPNGRCLSLPTLHEVGKARIWQGTPSTTQLLNPTRMEYLKIKHDYAINPFDMAFALLGTRHHHMLETVAKTIEGLQSEKKLEGEISTGILDLLEPDELYPDCFKLIDYKTWGAYAVAKVTGVAENGEYELWQATLQINNYKTMVEDLGIKVSRLFVQCTVRDGGTKSAYSNGIDYKMILIPIEILPEDRVKEYFLTKLFALKTSLDKNELPELCQFNERWAGKRCKGFCDVSSFCPEGAKINKVELEG